MRIENIELLELFLETVCAVSEDQSKHTVTREINQTTTLAQQLGNSVSLMENLAGHYEHHGESELALAAQRLANALANDDLLSSPELEVHERLLDYVYPVV